MKRNFIISAFILLVFNSPAQLFNRPDSISKECDLQITLITPLGTNGLDAMKYTNKISINILAGVSGGVNGLELGGIANTVVGKVNGIQAAGMANLAMKSVDGGQLAGFLNINGGNLNGMQLAGFLNYNEENTRGGQGAGFANCNLGKLHGIQGSGFLNINNDSLFGLQGTGFLNVNNGYLKGAQLSGFVNLNNGLMEGVQASGFFNAANKVKGFQLGIINIADSVEGGQFGFLNINKKGMHQVELSSDELFRANLAVRTGNQLFYNEFSTGFSPSGKKMLWHLGYGCGTSFRISNKLRTDISLSALHVSRGLLYNGTSELYRLYIGLEYKLNNKCHIAAGPTFNLYWGDTLLPDYAGSYNNIAPYTPFLDETSSRGFNYEAWAGGRLAFRFF